MTGTTEDDDSALTGGLMRGMSCNPVMTEAQAVFVGEAVTAAEHRMWSTESRFAAMIRARVGRRGLTVELWSLSPRGFVAGLRREPCGLSVAKVVLADGAVVLGVVGESALCEGQSEITAHVGWRAHLRSLEGERR